MYLTGSLHFFCFLSFIFLCSSESPSPNPTPKVFLRKAARSVLMQKYMNRSVDPCDNFYEFACGNWPKLNPKHKEVGTYNAFRNLDDKIKNYVIRLLNETDVPSNENPSNSSEQKARLFYQSCVHSNIFKYRRIEDYVSFINSIGGCPALNPEWKVEEFDWVKMVAHARSYGIDILIDEAVTNDENGTYIGLSIPKIGLVAFNSDDVNSRAYRINELLVKRILITYGVPKRKAKKLASNILELMVELIGVSKTGEDYSEAEDPRKTAPHIDWDEYLSIILGRPFDNTTEAALATPKYIRRLNALILRSDLQTVANYIAVKILFALHPEFAYKKYPEITCATLAHEYLEPIVNYMYMEKFYDKQSEKDIMEMVENIRDSFRKILESSEWLDDETKTKALAKLNALKSKVGLRDFILMKEQLENKYANLTFDPYNFYQNYLRFRFHRTSAAHKYQPELSVNNSDVDVTAVEVNAYYVPEDNTMMIPAGIMLPPFYHTDLPKAFTYGIIGSVIGHELTHGFDNNGRLYDSEGNEVDWWSEASTEAYEKRSGCMVDQYNNYTMPDLNVNVNGETTLGENIADNGGLREAYYAYKGWYERNDSEETRRNERLSPALNMTNTQIFFLSFAQGFCDHLDQTDLKSYVVDEHTINRYRIIGALSNFEEFAKEFHCPVGSTMNPEKKCRIF